jgi:hypothetical protein
MNPAEVVVHVMERNGLLQILKLFAECVREPFVGLLRRIGVMSESIKFHGDVETVQPPAKQPSSTPNTGASPH